MEIARITLHPDEPRLAEKSESITLAEITACVPLRRNMNTVLKFVLFYQKLF